MTVTKEERNPIHLIQFIVFVLAWALGTITPLRFQFLPSAPARVITLRSPWFYSSPPPPDGWSVDDGGLSTRYYRRIDGSAFNRQRAERVFAGLQAQCACLKEYDILDSIGEVIIQAPDWQVADPLINQALSEITNASRH